MKLRPHVSLAGSSTNSPFRVFLSPRGPKIDQAWQKSVGVNTLIMWVCVHVKFEFHSNRDTLTYFTAKIRSKSFIYINGFKNHKEASDLVHTLILYVLWSLPNLRPLYNFKAMYDKWLWPIFGCKVCQSVQIGMKLELYVWHHPLNVHAKFQTDISKHVQKSPENFAFTSGNTPFQVFLSARGPKIAQPWRKSVGIITHTI